MRLFKGLGLDFNLSYYASVSEHNFRTYESLGVLNSFFNSYKVAAISTLQQKTQF